MSLSTTGIVRASASQFAGLWPNSRQQSWWLSHREASLNWLALGLLLAAWNASDDAGARAARRPEELRGYSHVSVRAATLHSGELRGGSKHSAFLGTEIFLPE